MVLAENYCRFVGILQNYKLYEVEGGYSFGRGVLFLPVEGKEIGQYINIIASGEVANRMSLLKNNTWITALGSYAPSIFKGKLQDTFQISAFSIEY